MSLWWDRARRNAREAPIDTAVLALGAVTATSAFVSNLVLYFAGAGAPAGTDPAQLALSREVATLSTRSALGWDPPRLITDRTTLFLCGASLVVAAVCMVALASLRPWRGRGTSVVIAQLIAVAALA